MELTHTALDEVWKADGGGGARGSYPQARMAHLFDVIGAAFCRHVCRGSCRGALCCCLALSVLFALNFSLSFSSCLRTALLSFTVAFGFRVLLD